MALIKCPECGKEISDKAQMCIYCGYPISSISEKTGLYKVQLISAGNNEFKIVGELRTILGLDFGEAFDFIAALPRNMIKGLSYEDAKFVENMFVRNGAQVVVEEDHDSIRKIDIHKKIEEYEENAKKVHCPKCGSIEIGVTTGEIRMFDGFGGSGSPQNVCKRCGYHWIPRL